MEYVYDDGGRKEAGFRGGADDCVCRSISIATGASYLDVYKSLNELLNAKKAIRGASFGRQREWDFIPRPPAPI